MSDSQTIAFIREKRRLARRWDRLTSDEKWAVLRRLRDGVVTDARVLSVIKEAKGAETADGLRPLFN